MQYLKQKSKIILTKVKQKLEYSCKLENSPNELTKIFLMKIFNTTSISFEKLTHTSQFGEKVFSGTKICQTFANNAMKELLSL